MVNALLYLSEAILAAYVMRIVSIKYKIPSVSAYVVGGVLLGGSLFIWHPGGQSFSEQWLFTRDILSEMAIVTQIALALIALSIGAELEWKLLRTMGKSIVHITVFGAALPFLLVAGSIWLIWHDAALALILGAVSSATAPAATVAVIQQYRAKGPLTSTIIAVVGLDDAISFMFFAFSLTLVKGFYQQESFNLMHAALLPIWEIVLSLIIGSVVGFVVAKMLMRERDSEGNLFILAFLILFVSGISIKLHASSLLANMAAGAVIVNINPQLKKKIRLSFSSLTPVFYALFFILGGAHLDLSSLTVIWKLGLVYFVCRALGKVLGASLGAYTGKASRKIRKLIGISMLPQVGAAVALALVVEQEFGGGEFGPAASELARTIFNVLLVTTFFTEFVGPYLTKRALFEAGEARE